MLLQVIVVVVFFLIQPFGANKPQGLEKKKKNSGDGEEKGKQWDRRVIEVQSNRSAEHRQPEFANLH